MERISLEFLRRLILQKRADPTIITIPKIHPFSLTPPLPVLARACARFRHQTPEVDPELADLLESKQRVAESGMRDLRDYRFLVFLLTRSIHNCPPRGD